MVYLLFFFSIPGVKIFSWQSMFEVIYMTVRLYFTTPALFSMKIFSMD